MAFNDLGDVANWTGTFGAGTVANDANNFHAPPTAIKCHTVAQLAAAFKDGVLGVTGVARYSTYGFLSALPAADLLLGQGDPAGFKIGVAVQADGTLKLVSGATDLGSGGALAAATRTRLTVTANIANATTYTVKLFKDNAQVVSVTNGAAIDQTGNSQRLHIGLIANSSLDFWFSSTYADADGSNTNIGYPHIASITPNSGPAGTAVTIAGFGFGAVQGGSSVDVGGTPLTITTWSDTSIDGTIPSVAAGAKTVTVTTAAVGISNPITFTVTAAGGGPLLIPFLRRRRR